MIGIPVGLVAANATEWVVHKYVLHGLGKRKGSFWSFHWHEHHKVCRKQGHRDPAYERSVIGTHGQGKEAAALVGAVAAVLPFAPVAPFFVGTLCYSALNYYRKHKRAHLDPEWAREHLAWHYDHHMGPEQDANWCVTKPWFDKVMGTRVRYVGTEREQLDQTRKAQREARREARMAAAPRPGPVVASPESVSAVS